MGLIRRFLSDRARLLALRDLLSSNVAANLVLFGGIYIVSQLVSPAEFGRYSIFIAFTLAIYPILTLRLEQAIPIADDETTARMLFWICISCSSALTIIVIFLGCVDNIFNISNYFIGEEVAEFLPLLAPAAFALSVVGAVQAVVLRVGALRGLALSRVVRALSLVATQILLASVWGSGWVLIVGDIIANITLIYLLMRYIPWFVPRKQTFDPKSFLHRVFPILKKYKEFALVNLPHTITNQVLVACQATVLGALYGATSLGQYFLMNKVVFGTVGLVSTSMYQVCLAEASSVNGEPRKMRGIWLYLVVTLASITLPVGLVLLLFGEVAFSFLFGDKWGGAGLMTQYAFLSIIVQPIAASLAFFPVFASKQRQAFAWNISQNFFGMISFALAYCLGFDAPRAVLFWSLAVGMVLLLYIIWTRTLYAETARP